MRLEIGNLKFNISNFQFKIDNVILDSRLHGNDALAIFHKAQFNYKIDKRKKAGFLPAFSIFDDLINYLIIDWK